MSETYFLKLFEADLKWHQCIPKMVHNVDDLESGITSRGARAGPCTAVATSASPRVVIKEGLAFRYMLLACTFLFPHRFVAFGSWTISGTGPVRGL